MSNSNTSGNDLEERLISFGVNIIVISVNTAQKSFKKEIDTYYPILVFQ